MDKLLKELLQVAFGNRRELSFVPTTNDWKKVYRLSIEQSIVGICFLSAQRVRSFKPELLENLEAALRMQWLGVSTEILRRNEVLNDRSRELYNKLCDSNINSCLLKGQAYNSYYTKILGEECAYLRQAGDIDMWMIGDVGQVLYWIKQNGHLKTYDYHHADCTIFSDVEVELHYRPSISRNLIRNKRLQQWFNGEGKNHIVFDERLRLNIPDSLFSIILALNHNLWHLVVGGVGLRQTIDLYVVVKSAWKMKDINLSELKRLIDYFQLSKFAAASAWVMWHVFENERKDSFLLFKDSPLPYPDEKKGKFLLEEIIEAGNFGKYDKRNTKKSHIAQLNMLIALKHSLRLICQYRTEVLWGPIGMVSISLWRRMRIRA